MTDVEFLAYELTHAVTDVLLSVAAAEDHAHVGVFIGVMIVHAHRADGFYVWLVEREMPWRVFGPRACVDGGRGVSAETLWDAAVSGITHARLANKNDREVP